MAGDLHMLVLTFEFHQNRLSGFGVVGGGNLSIPIDLAIGLYNSLYYRTSRDCSVVLSSHIHICTRTYSRQITGAEKRRRPYVEKKHWVTITSQHRRLPSVVMWVRWN